MTFDLIECREECWNCIKGYKKKHELKKGDKFEVKCRGILKNPVQLSLLESLPEDERQTVKAIMDPVEWAAQNLDWHCFDEDGEIWKRKDPDEYWQWVADNPGESIKGKSRYHRPYQGEMLRCTANNKVFRIGRQAGKTETLVVSMLYHMFTKPGKSAKSAWKIVLITPYQTQIELVFSRLLELMRGSPITSNSIARSVKAPNYTIQLNNGSYIKGFTAGTKSAGNADSVRGQMADQLVFDEADYLSSADMDSAMSVVTNSPNARVWMSSTPSGKREKFFDTCFDDSFREFFFPSMVNPLWDKDKEKLFKRQLTEIGYKHEILGEFGEQEEGVFQYNYVKAAHREYEYGELPYRSDWTYTIGVDWNDTKNGTTIVVLGFNPANKKFTIVDRKTVSREGWTQLLACQKIAELNRIWHPIVIQIDAGHGGTQWEVLRAYGGGARTDPTRGPKHPDARLLRIVKKYNFSSKVQTRDIFTGMPLEKPAKPFLVESTVRRFEAADIVYPASDDFLTRQLLGYIIERVTPTGIPVYKANDEEAGDHVLDALMLSVMGFVLEVTPLGKPKYDPRITFSGQFGQIKDIAENESTPPSRNPLDKPPTRESVYQTRADTQRPEMERAAAFEQQSLFPEARVPAAHTRVSGARPWAWDGFFRDEPAPVSKKRTFSSRGGRSCRPRRKNI